MRKTILLLFVLSALLAAATAAVNPSTDDPAPMPDDEADGGAQADDVSDSLVRETIRDNTPKFPDGGPQADDALGSSVRENIKDDIPKFPDGGPQPDDVLDSSVRQTIRRDIPKFPTLSRFRRRKYPPQCKCRLVPANRKKRAVCYDMLIPLQAYGRCKRRRCGKKYECVPGGGKGLKDCIRRIATYQTKLRREEKGVFLCNTYKMKPKVYYTLY